MKLLRVRRLFAGETVARFGTTGPGGRPQMMPVPFAVIDDDDDGVVVCAVEHQPRSIAGTARLRDIRDCPRVSFMTDQSGSTDARWWVHADAVAEVLRRGTTDPRFALATEALADRYEYLRHGPDLRSVVWATVTSWTGSTAVAERAA